MKVSRLPLLVASISLLGAATSVPAALLLTETSSAPTGAAIAQPDFSAPAFNGSQDFSDNAGPPGQTFTPAASISLNSLTVKGFANTSASFGGFPATFTLTISQVSATTLTQKDQETTASFAPASGSDYLTFTLASPVALTAGTQYAYDIFTSAGYFGFAKSTADVYLSGAAIQAGSTARTSTNGETITNTQTVDRTFFINGSVPEPGSVGLLAVGGLGLLVRRRRA